MPWRPPGHPGRIQGASAGGIGYILMLVQKRRDGDCAGKVVIADIGRAIASSCELRSERDPIEGLVDGLGTGGDAAADWERRIAERREKGLADIIEGERLDDAATREFPAKAFANSEVPETGTEITRLMTVKPSRFAPANAYTDMKARILDRLKAFFGRFSNLGSN